MRLLDTRRDDLNALRRLFDSRLDSAAHEAEGTVRAILDDVRERGDAGVLDYTRRWGFERADALRVTEEQTAAAVARIQATPLWPVLNLAVVRIRAFHERQLRQTWVDASRPGEM